ncbi:hypothetical protein C7M84_024309 [Penaeus vannamei]|uniref:Uncharacterized protein n=1 Tax=Penaeus vannamei TaxID=6689 RepID=A0A423U1E8_PENVA|nr:hypothetical protein C7M84_024309 [Penaeus vannamei]
MSTLVHKPLAQRLPIKQPAHPYSDQVCSARPKPFLPPDARPSGQSALSLMWLSHEPFAAALPPRPRSGFAFAVNNPGADRGSCSLACSVQPGDARGRPHAPSRPNGRGAALSCACVIVHCIRSLLSHISRGENAVGVRQASGVRQIFPPPAAACWPEPRAPPGVRRRSVSRGSGGRRSGDSGSSDGGTGSGFALTRLRGPVGRDQVRFLDRHRQRPIDHSEALRPGPPDPATSVTEYAYVHHQVKIVGEASVPLTLGTGRASHEVLFSFLVTSDSSRDILAMDFLTDFQCELTLDAEMSMSMSRQPQAPRQKYPSPYLALKVSSGKDKSFRSKFVVDTGARNTISLQRAESNGLKLDKPFSRHGHRCHKVSDKVVISSGEFSRQLIDPQCFSLGKICKLGEKGLKRTVISLKDWTMTFKNNKGDITLPFL